MVLIYIMSAAPSFSNQIKEILNNILKKSSNS